MVGALFGTLPALTRTLAAGHLNCAVVGPGAVVTRQPCQNDVKPSSTTLLYRFVTVAVQTLGALGDAAIALLRDIDQRIAAVTGEPRSHQFLMQQLSLTVHRGNAACVLGTVTSNLRPYYDFSCSIITISYFNIPCVSNRKRTEKNKIKISLLLLI
jgi:hypothetical protein